jgi:hypothetical protein
MKFVALNLTFSSLDPNVVQEVKLAETRAERDLQDSLAEVFSIIITLDELEKAYLKDAILESDYTEICDRLLKQYKAILTDDAVSREFVDLETFKGEWDVSYISHVEVHLTKANRWKYLEPQNVYGSAYPAQSQRQPITQLRHPVAILMAR